MQKQGDGPAGGEAAIETPLGVGLATLRFVGFDPEVAAELGPVLTLLVQRLSEDKSKLGALESVTAAADYPQALRDVDRGSDAAAPLAVTQEPFGQGVAMTVVVKRGGAWKSVIVLSDEVIRLLRSESEIELKFGIYIAAHELAHASGQEELNTFFPGQSFGDIADLYDGILFGQSAAAWSEYHACRLSADVMPEQYGLLLDTLFRAMEAADSRITDATTAYWESGNRQAAFDEILPAVGSLVKFSGYLMGHCDGIGADPIASSEDLRAKLEEFGLTDWFREMHRRLRELFGRTGAWEGIHEFLALNESMVAAADAFGVEFWRSDESFMFDIRDPFAI